jgi:hypothetical protein
MAKLQRPYGAENQRPSHCAYKRSLISLITNEPILSHLNDLILEDQITEA